MSVEFTITESRLSLNELNQILRKWSKSLGKRHYFSPKLNGDTPPSALVLGEGSVRGVRVIREEAKIRIQLSSMASRGDWRYAFSLMAETLEAGGGALEREDGTVLAASDLNEEQADSLALEDLRFSIRTFRKAFKEGASEFGSAKLPVSLFEIPFNSDDLPQDLTPSVEAIGALESSLASRVSSYALAAHAKTYVLDNGVRISSWGLVPTLIYQADHVVLREAEDPIPLSVVITALGDRAEACGKELWYLPAIDGATDAEIIAAMVAGAEPVPGFIKPNISGEFEREKVAEAVSEILASSEASAKTFVTPDPVPMFETEAVSFVETEAFETEPAEAEIAEPEVAESVEATSKTTAPPLPGDATKIVVDCLVSGLLSSEDPDQVAESLKAKLDIATDTMDLLVAVTAQTLRELFGVDGEPKPIEEVCDRLLEDGVSESLVKMVVSAIFKELSAVE